MNLRETILQEHSKAQKDKIVEWVGGSQKRFDELAKLFLVGEPRIVQRAAWPMMDCAIAHPKLVQKYMDVLLKKLHEPGIHDAVKRNTTRLFQYIDVPETYHGELMDLCFNYLASPTEAVAIKAFSLTVLQNLSRIYPEIVPEVKLLIEDRIDYETAAFRSRARKFLKRYEV